MLRVKHLFRFRLASLLLLTAFVAIWIAATIRPLRYLADAERIRELGGRVANRETNLGIAGMPYLVFCRFTGRHAEVPCILTLDERCPSSAPALRIAGRIPTLASLDLTRSDVNDNSFAFLKPLRHVQHIRVQGRPLANESMLIVGRWTNLRTASFHGTDIDDAGVARLAGCEQLIELSLRSTKLTARSVETLVSLKRLERLDVSNCGLPDEAIQQLVTSLPHCGVESRDPWLVEAGP